jgi:surfeit locus 1 family protein
MQLLKALFSRRWWWLTLIVLALMVVLARLGVWQLDRLQQRREANVELAASLASAPIDLADAALPDDISSWENRLVVATGTFDHEQQVLLKVQNWGRHAGVHLITPLLLADGGTAVLVDRGWIPDEETDPQARSAYDVTGEQTIEGYIALTQELSREPAVLPEGPQQEWYRVDIAAIQPQMPYTLLPFYVVQSPQNDNAQLPYRLEREIDLSEGPHLSYAIQWFIFSIGLGVAYLAFIYKNAIQSNSS